MEGKWERRNFQFVFLMFLWFWTFDFNGGREVEDSFFSNFLVWIFLFPIRSKNLRRDREGARFCAPFNGTRGRLVCTLIFFFFGVNLAFTWTKYSKKRKEKSSNKKGNMYTYESCSTKDLYLKVWNTSMNFNSLSLSLYICVCAHTCGVMH